MGEEKRERRTDRESGKAILAPGQLKKGGMEGKKGCVGSLRRERRFGRGLLQRRSI